MNGLKSGKLPPELLKTFVLGRISTKRPEVIVHAGLGEDSAVIDFGEWACVVSTDPITGARKDAGWLAVHVTCNDVASNGAEPIGVLVTVLCPERLDKDLLRSLGVDPRSDVEGEPPLLSELPSSLGLPSKAASSMRPMPFARVQASVKERASLHLLVIDRIMKDAARAASELGIEILGGHTEITPGLPQPIISATAIGKAPRDRVITSSGANPGDLLILTKGAGIEGTAILASDFEELLKGALRSDVLEGAKRFTEKISVVKEGLIASKNGASAMHDVTEGGVLGAIYEMAEASGVGVEVWVDRIPVAAETKKICDFFSIDPMKLISSGSMLISAPKSDPILSLLKKEGIEASVIGRVVQEGRVLIKNGIIETLYPPESDELWKAVLQASASHESLTRDSPTPHFVPSQSYFGRE